MGDLQQLLKIGMSKHEILKRFGPPDLTVGGNRELMMYGLQPFQAQSPMEGTFVTGLDLVILHDHLIDWTCTYTAPPIDTHQTSLQPSSERHHNEQRSPPSIKFFIVDPQLIPDAQLDVMEQTSKWNLSNSRPVMVIDKLKDASGGEYEKKDSNGASAMNWEFDVSLYSDDGERLRLITTKNISNRVVMQVNNIFVYAPIIMAPIDAGSFVIQCRQKSVADDVRKALQEMIK